MEIELVTSDYSGVISDDRRTVYYANMKILRDYRKPTMSFDEWLPRTTLTPVEFLANQGVYGNPDKLFALYKRYFDEAVASGIVPQIYSGVYKTFQYLKKRGKRIAILSSHPTENLTKELEEYNLLGFVDLVLGNSRDKVQGLKDITKSLNIEMENTIIIGDTIFEVRAGKEVGAKTCAVYSGYHSKEVLFNEKPDLLLKGIYRLRFHLE